MALILNIETSATVCSVCLSHEENILAVRKINNGYTHAENLHVFIKDILDEKQINATELSAIAVSKGPGSYTGLRIGVSAAKGMAFALNIPLISVDTLQIMADAALESAGDEAFYYPMLDARRMEVYTAGFDCNADQVLNTRAMIIDEASIAEFASNKKKYFFGDGMPKCRSILEKIENSGFIENILPSAECMPFFSFRKYLKERFEDVAYFEPFYLKDFYIHSKKK